MGQRGVAIRINGLKRTLVLNSRKPTGRRFYDRSNLGLEPASLRSTTLNHEDTPGL